MDKKLAADKAVTTRDAAPEFSGGLATLVGGGDEGMLVPPGDGAPPVDGGVADEGGVAGDSPVTLMASFWPASQ